MVCTVASVDFAIAELTKQNWRCKYPNVPLSFVENTHWMCSVNRNDKTNGHEVGNIEFSAAEFRKAGAMIVNILSSMEN